MHPKPSPRFSVIPFAIGLLGVGLCAATIMGLAGCASTDLVRAAERGMERAGEYEDASAFFAPVLARVKGEPGPPRIRPQAKHHYLGIIANLEGLSVKGERSLQEQGLLGEAFVLKTLAQWRLDRVAEARTSSLRAKASGQEALDAMHRALFVAFDGVVQLQGALDALADKRPYAEIAPAITGSDGAWKTLGMARTEALRGNPIQVDLMQTRLAAIKILRDARLADDAAAAPTADGAWERLAAEAQVELRELASFPAADAEKHQEMVVWWARNTGLILPES